MQSIEHACSREGNGIRLYSKTLLSDTITPVQAYFAFARAYSFLFESTEPDTRLARFSIISFEPKEIISISANTATIEDPIHNRTLQTTFDCPLKLLSQRLATLPVGKNETLEHLPFTCGLVGYMAYSCISYFEPVERQEKEHTRLPELCFGLYDSSIVFDHLMRRIHVISARSKEHVEEIVSTLESCRSLKPLEFPSPGSMDFSKVRSSMTREEFEARVRRTIELIADGQAAQIVLSQRFCRPGSVDPKTLYRYITALNPSPYSYILQYPDFSYVGSSPEPLVRFNGREAQTKALAGTRPRGKDIEADNLLERDLKHSEKEMAEHLMLVDLARNDLGRVSIPGTVKTGEIAQVVKFSRVMHLATEVSGEIEPTLTAFDVTKSCFPQGTVSGAPKVRAMQHLHHLEPESRGIYSGLVGYFDVSGKSEQAIAIRSALVTATDCHVNAGAGIVFDSDPSFEYNETLHKASSVLSAIEQALAVETSR